MYDHFKVNLFRSVTNGNDNKEHSRMSTFTQKSTTTEHDINEYSKVEVCVHR